VKTLAKMVRIKHRYLLINILYPGPTSVSLKSSAGEAIPDVVQFHAPTSDKLNNQLLARMIREGVRDMFGEWGLGVIAGSLKSTVLFLSRFFHPLLALNPDFLSITLKTPSARTRQT
jgi:RNase P/RNase MRP subunit POP5